MIAVVWFDSVGAILEKLIHVSYIFEKPLILVEQPIRAVLLDILE